MIVLDASVILKGVLVEEPESEKVLHHFSLHKSGADEIVVPSLLYYEAANICGRGEHRFASPTELLRIIFGLGFREEVLTPPDFTRILTLMSTTKTTAYDAAYVVLAERLRCPFVTADRKLFQKIQSLKFVALL